MNLLKPIVEKKVKRNKTMLTIIDLQVNEIKINMAIKYRVLESLQKKAQLIKEITQLEELQKENYCCARETQILNLTREVDTICADLAPLKEKTLEIQSKMKPLITELDLLTNQIIDYGPRSLIFDFKKKISNSYKTFN